MLLLLQVSREMINYYDSVYDKALITTYSDPEKPRAAALVLKVFHEVVRAQSRHAAALNGGETPSFGQDSGVTVFQLNCCGKGQATNILTQLMDKVGVTDLCPSSGTAFVSFLHKAFACFTPSSSSAPGSYIRLSFLLQTCHERIQELFSDKIYVIGIAALVVAVIMVRSSRRNRHPVHASRPQLCRERQALSLCDPSASQEISSPFVVGWEGSRQKATSPV